VASLNVIFGYVGGKGGPQEHMPVIRDTNRETLNIGSVATTTVATAPFTQYGDTIAVCQVTAIGSPCWVDHSQDGGVTSGMSYLILDGQTRDIHVNAGDRISCVEATGL